MPLIADVAPNGKLDSANWGNPIRDRTQQIFASQAERDTWTTAPNGAHCLTLDAGRHWIRRAGAWWPDTGLVVPPLKLTGASGQVSAEAVISGSTLAWTADPTRTYRLLWLSLMVGTVVGDFAIARIRQGNTTAGTQVAQAGIYIAQTAQGVTYPMQAFLTGLAGAQSYSVTIQRYSGTGLVQNSAAPAAPSMFTVEDVGPAAFTLTQLEEELMLAEAGAV